MEKGMIGFLSCGVVVMFLITTVTSFLGINVLMDNPGKLIFSVGSNCDIYAFIYNDKIAFSGYDTTNDYFLIVYDTDTEVRTELYSGPNEVTVGGISKDFVVYYKNDGNDEDIYYYDLNTGKETAITNDNYDQVWPTIAEDTVYWIDESNGMMMSDGRSVQSYDLNTVQSKEVLSGLSLVSNDIRISGNYMVFSEERNLTLQVQLYNLYSKVTTTIYNTSMKREGGFGWSPVSISGDQVVWTDYLNGSAVLFMYDIPTRSTEYVTVSGQEISTPTVQDGLVVYIDYPGEKSRLVSYDPETRTTAVIGEYDRINFYSRHDDRLVINIYNNGNGFFDPSCELYLIDL